ncbi:type VI secretion system ATPase TssH [Ramlibacter sp. XY19]|uniref:type VI secretion system ATPase TssH n=1 Tax=Ramlibacter paludis TaxID=2908000 RepID=UPI0023DC7F26|nr:type VI secretion system ATPase TssH [Ramlibacter paludis]MCG2595118.1 type VI secretion system ATPase TssH [Ramlibacter paludis]
MSEISRSKLFSKLDATTFKALESATVFCKLRGNPYVELVHWLFQLKQIENGDLALIARQFDLDPARLQADFTAALDALPRGSSSISDLSSHIDEAVERAWTYASVMYGSHKVRTGHILIGALKSNTLRNALLAISREFSKVKVERLTDEFDTLLAGSVEAQSAAQAGGSGQLGEASGAMGPGDSKDSALAKYAQDLTAKAEKGEIDPVLGRDHEIRQIVDILMRRRQNNPILTGEAGVGKTSVVEGFALRVVKGDVPPQLRGVRICSLDLGALQAGASMKGEFENRLRQVIEEVQSSATPIILFIDEAHTLIGAGGAAGTGDAANLLKPALARGKLRTVAATTFAEYKKYFEKDPALTRRFQVIQVGEPDEEKGIQMLRGVVPVLEQHHKVEIMETAVEAAVRLSHRYIPARQLPDKGVSLLDTACARVAVSQYATPAAIEDRSRQRDVLQTEQEILKRETHFGASHDKRLTAIEMDLAALNEELAALDARWQTEKELTGRILELRRRMREEPEQRGELMGPLNAAQGELSKLQKETQLVIPTVDDMVVASVVQDWTGIPVGKMVGDEIQNILKLADTLDKRVIGQRHGLEMIAKRIQTSAARLDNPNKPVGVFMLCGPSGVGKTETALALADAMYGGEQNIITINMSEYQEAHTVSSLKGAPPGYVGYGEGGVLTEAVRRRPYSVVLLDEVEKAHPDVHEIFFQVFDKGWMEDGEGRMIDFRNTLILLTSNVGTETIADLCADPELAPGPEEIAKALRAPLLKVFPPALLGRIVTIPYYPLSDQMLSQIIRLQLDRIVKRFGANHEAVLSYTDDVVGLVASRCTEVESGGRMIDAILTNSVLPRLSEIVLGRLIEQKPLSRIDVTVQDKDFAYSVG